MIHILHISDLHFVKNAAAYNTEEILLREAAKRVKDVPLGKKLLIVTGDFHNFWDQDYKKAEDFLQKLVSKMGLNINQDVFVIPGNHDVGNDEALKHFLEPKDSNWKKHHKAWLTMLKTGDKDYIEERLQVFSPYSAFVRKLGIYDDSSSDDYPARSHVRCWRGRLNILHLNTALIADGTSKTEQMTDADMAASPDTWKDYFGSTVPSIAIGHNDFFDLKKVQRTDLASIFNLRNVSAYLCGDRHRTEKDPEHQMIRLESGHKQGIEIPNLVAARSIADGDDDYSEVGFCWHCWDEDTDEVTVEFRKWTRENLAETVPDGLKGEYVMRREKPDQSGPDDTEKAIRDETPSEKGNGYTPLRRYLADVLKQRRDSHPSFQLLKVDEIDSRLYPEIKEYKPEDPNVEKGHCPVWDIIRDSWSSSEHRNIVITGDGGIGKTVTLFSISLDSYKDIDIPALYIPMYELVALNGNLLEIDEYIEKKYKKYSGKIDDLATESWDTQPSLLLLLDGLNEVPFSLRRKALTAVNDWYDMHPGVQIIAVSRPMDGINLSSELSGNPVSVTLAKLEPSIVRGYLKDARRKIPSVKSPLWEDLRYPLFLNLYVKTGRLKGKYSAGYPLDVKDANSGGALIWNFLQRELLRHNRDKNEKAESWFLRCAVANEFILPYLAYQMVSEHRMDIDYDQAVRWADEALEQFDGNCLPNHLKKIWETYNRQHGTFPDINLFSRNRWRDTALQESGILLPFIEKKEIKEPTSAYGKFVFMHQHFRDCLAGLYLINMGDMARENLPSVWKQGHNHIVLDYTAELIEEETVDKLWEINRLSLQYNAPGYKKDHSGTFSLLELQKRRKPLPEKLNFSGMDLQNESLAHYMTPGYGYLPLFQKSYLTYGTKINRSTVQSEGHVSSITCITILPDGRIVSGSFDNSLRVWDPDSGRCLHVLQGHSQWIRCLAVLPDGRIVSGSEDHSLRVWDPDSEKCLHVLQGHSQRISCLAVLPDARIVSGSGDHSLRVWDPDSEKCLHVLDGHSSPITCLAVLPDGRIVSGSEDHSLRVWDPDSSTCLYVLQGHSWNINCLAVLPDGRIVSGSYDNSLLLWDPNSEKCLHVLQGHSRNISCLAVLPGGRIVSGSEDHSLRVWDPISEKCLHVLDGHSSPISCLAVLPDGRIVSGSYDNSLRVWDPDSEKCLHVLQGHSRNISCLAVLPGGLIVSGSYDSSLRVWDPDSEKCLNVFERHSNSINCLAVLQNGHIVSGSIDNSLRVWDPDSEKCLHVLQGHSHLIRCLAVLPDGRIVSGSYDNSLRVWDPDSEKCLHVLQGHSRNINCLDALPGGLIVSGSSDNSLRVWDPDSEKCLHVLQGHSGNISCLAVLPGGRIVSGSTDNSLRVWDPDSEKCLHVLQEHSQLIRCLAVLPDGRIVSGSYDKSLRVWDPDSGTCLHVLQGHSSWISCLAVLPGGLIVSGSYDKSLRVWDPDSGTCLHVLQGHSHMISCLAVLPGGLIVSGSEDNSLRVWDSSSGRCLHVLQGHSRIINCLAVLSDDRIVSESFDGTLRVWDYNNELSIHSIDAAEKDFSQMDFSEAILTSDLPKLLWQNRAKISKNDYENYVLPTIPK